MRDDHEMTDEEWNAWIDEIIALEPKNGVFTAPMTKERWEQLKQKWREEDEAEIANAGVTNAV